MPGWDLHAGGGKDSQETAKETQEEHTYGCCYHYHHIYMSYLQ